jgi:opacity protein-like surface antigen
MAAFSRIIFALLCLVAATPALAFPCADKPGAGSTVGWWHWFPLPGGKKCWHFDHYTSTAIHEKQHIEIVTNWTGPYAGANAGFGSITLSPGGLHPWIAPETPATVNAQSAMVGGQFGWGWRYIDQTGKASRWVLRVEDQIEYVNVRATDWTNLISTQVQWTNTTNIQAAYTLNPRWIVYGGLGGAEAERASQDLFTGLIATQRLLGWDGEVGTQVMVSDKIAARVNGQFMNFGPGVSIWAIKAGFDLIPFPNTTVIDRD